MIKKKEEPCQFEENNVCKALACYSKQACSARDADGGARYSGHKSMDDIKYDVVNEENLIGGSHEKF